MITWPPIKISVHWFCIHLPSASHDYHCPWPCPYLRHRRHLSYQGIRYTVWAYRWHPQCVHQSDQKACLDPSPVRQSPLVTGQSLIHIWWCAHRLQRLIWHQARHHDRRGKAQSRCPCHTGRPCCLNLAPHGLDLCGQDQTVRICLFRIGAKPPFWHPDQCH